MRNANRLFVFMLWMLLLSGCIRVANAVTPQISAGVASTAVLKQDGTVWGVGGISGYWRGALQPTRLFPAINDAKQVSTASADYALRANGELWASGRNEKGQVGDGTTAYRDRINPYKVLDGVTQFAASHMTALALKGDGSVWAWGDNTHGGLGDGTRISRLSPVRITGLANVIMVTAGNSHGTALTADGGVWAWGTRGFFADADANWYPADDPLAYVLTPRQLPNLANIVSIASGSGNLALDTSGKLWSHGAAWTGTLGNGTTENAVNAVPVSIPGKVKAYSIGWGHALAVTEDGSVWAWGTNTSGQLGVPFSGINTTPAKISSLPGPAVNVAAGLNHSAVLLADGSVMTFGDDSISQLGRGVFQSDYAPGFMVSETGSGSFSATTPAPANLADAPSVWISAPGAVDGTVKGFVPLTASMTANGNAASGRSIVRYDWVSSDGSIRTQGSSVSLDFTQPGAIDVYAVATDDSGLKGAGLYHIMPLPADVPVSVTPQIVSAGITFNALTGTGEVYSWGGPWQLGSQAFHFGKGPQGSSVLPVDPGLRGIVKLASANGASFALTQGGLVLAWGFNSEGVLGIGSTMSWNWDPVLVSLPKAATDIVGGGSSQAFALLNDGTVWAWGGNGYGQLGLTDTAARNRPVQLPGLANITKIYASYRNGYAIDQNGSVWAWGDNSEYQLGQGNNTPRLGVVKVNSLPAIAKLAAGDTHVLAIARDGRVFGWSNWHGFLGDTTLPIQVASPMQVPALSGFTDFASGVYTLGVKYDGSIWAWGANWGGGLPGGSTNSHEVSPIKIHGLSHPVAMALSYAGGAIVLNDGNVVTWGQNDYGQIGDGTLARRQSPVLVANSTADGYLNLITGTTANAPLGLQVPFFTVASGDVTTTNATVSTTTKFNATDVGKSGSVFVTAWTPSDGLGKLGISTARLNHAMSVTVNHDNPYLGGKTNVRQENLGTVLATSDPNTFVLVQLTSSGWQLVSNGQLIPYASGVLGDQLATQTILSGTDTTNLKGAEFCLGYGTSAEEMASAGRMRAVATIPDPNATSTTAGSCIIQNSNTNTAANVTAQAMEFYNSKIDHYFMTASTDEATALDNKPEWNWTRTGKTFNIWFSQSSASSNASPVCRFFGVFSNGTVGSHFYTVDTTECDMVKGRLDWGWGYENNAFYAVKPTGSTCPSGTAPIYRAYNNGMGGAPNHRYVATQAEVDTMVAQGWVSEGTALCGVQ